MGTSNSRAQSGARKSEITSWCASIYAIASRGTYFALPFGMSSPHADVLKLARAVRDSGYSFTTVTPATHERVNRRPENAWANDLQGVFGWSRPFRKQVISAEVFDLMRRADVLLPFHEEPSEAWRSRVRFTSLHGQLIMHSAYPTIEADAVFFGPDTYRFANALEHLFALNPQPVRRAIDIGCGAGPGALLCALQHPQAEVIGADINEAALAMTRVNAALAEAHNLKAHNSNLLSDVDGDFDLIMSNPPYLLDPSERAYRHGGGPLGAGLSLAIVEEAVQRLAPGGTLLIYTGVAMMNNHDPFRQAVSERIPQDFTWSYYETDPDVFGEELESEAYAACDRIAAVVLTGQKPQ